MPCGTRVDENGDGRRCQGPVLLWCYEPDVKLGRRTDRHPRLWPRSNREHVGEILQIQGSPAAANHFGGGGGAAMEVVHERCCGMDVHKKTVVACVRTDQGQETRTFGTMTRELLRLWDWLDQEHVSAVAMESTGVYWKPVYNVLESLGVELMVVNAQHMKAVPGRKTDVKDAEWIADLLRHGLLRASFIPAKPPRQLRELTRHRTTLVQDRARVVNRWQTVLEDANIKLSSVVTDIRGVSARAMLEALIAGERDGATLAELARGRLRAKRDQLVEALQGYFTPHHSFLLTEYLSQIDDLDDAIDRVSAVRTRHLAAEHEAIALLDSIPGVSQRTAEILLAEIGTDMTRF